MMTKLEGLSDRDTLFPAFVFTVCSVSNLTSVSKIKINIPDPGTNEQYEQFPRSEMQTSVDTTICLSQYCATIFA